MCNQVLKLKKNNPGPRIVETLRFHSLSNDFEEARREWQYITRITNRDEGFVEHCELCGKRNYNYNVLIKNSHTKAELKIGTECIKKFIPINGIQNQEEVELLLKQKLKEEKIEHLLSIQFNVLKNATKPPLHEVFSFCKKLKCLLKTRGQLHLLDTLDGIGDVLDSILNVAHYTPYDVKTLDYILVNPKKYTKKGASLLKKHKGSEI